MLLMFQVCFFVGVGLAIVSALLGSVCDFLGVDGLDFDFAGVELSIPLTPTVYIGFVTAFGGVGWILNIANSDIPSVVIMLIAIAAGVIVSGTVYKAVIIPLRKAQNTSSPDSDELIGLLARINETIPEGGYGEITYSIHGNSYTSPAKSVDNKEISIGKDVSICWIKEHVFYVSEINE